MHLDDEFEKDDISANLVENDTHRDENLLKCRPQVKTNNSVLPLQEEAFQNHTLRPILKFQNEIILELFRDYALKYAKNFSQLNTEKKEKFIEQSMQKDAKLRSLFKGIVLGHLTSAEFESYTRMSSEINKRIYSLILERLKSQMIYFE